MAGLREQAEIDLGFIIEGDPNGFRFPITVTDPTGATTTGLFGFSDDIAQLIDPDTGQAVSGRLASVAIRMRTLSDQGFTLPQGIVDASVKPWLVAFADILGTSYTFKVQQSNPDRAIGLLTLILEAYTP